VGGTVLGVSSRALLSACDRLGLDTHQILAAAGVDPAFVDDPDRRVPIEQFGKLWRAAYELSNDPNLSLHAIEVLPFGAYRVIDFMIWNAPTVGDGLAKVSDYFPLINNVVRLPFLIGDRFVTFAVEAPSDPAVITRPYAEYVLAAVFLRTRFNMPEPYRLARVEFTHPQPASVREHERIFGCPVVFGADACQLVIAREVWDSPKTGADPTLFSVLVGHARTLLDQQRADTTIVGRVRETIGAELRGGDPGLESVAKQLAMSPRTLQRRLSEHGAIFNEVLDAMRYAAAKSHLAQREIAATEVAYLLGFAEQSSFNRAFKRWSGQTPGEFRRSNPAA
jgi:AraC-like DNA-binding protein